MSTNEKAPSSWGRTSTRARSRARPSLDSSLAAGSSALDHLGHEVAVAGDHAGQHPGLVGEGLGVDEVAVVAEGELAGRGVPEHGLGVAPAGRAGGRVAGVADAEVAGQGLQRPVVEDRGHEAHVLDDGDVVAGADRHAGRLLAAVLQGVEAEVEEVGDRLARGVHPEDPAGLLLAVFDGLDEQVVVRRRHAVEPSDGPGRLRAPAADPQLEAPTGRGCGCRGRYDGGAWWWRRSPSGRRLSGRPVRRWRWATRPQAHPRPHPRSPSATSPSVKATVTRQR